MRTVPRILVVEDETIVAMDIARGLKRSGYEVVATTGRGEEALQLAEAHRPDLVLMDIRLQGAMDGIEAGRSIRQRFKIPIVFLTAHADAATVARAKAAEPFGYLLKPFEDPELHTAIQIALHKRAAEEAALGQADEALRQSEERFRLLVEGLKDYAVFLLDVQGRIVSWNPGAECIKGYAQNEVLGQHFSIFYRPEEVVRNQPDKTLWAAAQEGRVHDEGWRLRKDGTRFWGDTVITALRDRSGELVGFARITHDITDRKEAEEAIRQLNTTLEQKVQERTAELNAANRELEAFTYSVAHDLRAPLRGLRGFLCVLQEEAGPNLSNEVAEYIGKGTSCAERMSQLIDDLLNLSRVGRLDLQPSAVALNQLVEEVRAELKPEAEGRQLEWQIEPLPVVQCDAGLMKQVFANLLGNALKYTRPRERARIQVGQLRRGSEAVLFVRDNGVGFNMQQADKLFQPFCRLHRAEQFPGTGVGLATVERIIRKHGGRIWAEAQEGQGAAFFFTLGPSCYSASHGQEPNLQPAAEQPKSEPS